MDFNSFANACGLIIRHIEHGRWIRVPTEDHPHKRNGAYFHGGEYAFVQNWATMEKPDVWKSDKNAPDIEARIKRDADKFLNERNRKAGRAAGKAKWILENSELYTHPYLARKGFPKHKAFVNDSLLVIPMYFNGEICGAQTITPEGEKKFIYGQRCSEAYFRIGAGKNEFLVEGYASGLSLQAILAALSIQNSIYVCFSAGNALKLAKTHPNAIWIADNDISKTGENAAVASGLKWWMPEQAGWDINDLHLASGLFKCREILKKFLQ